MVLLVMFISPAYLVLLSNFVLRAQFNSQKTRSQPIGPPLLSTERDGFAMSAVAAALRCVCAFGAFVGKKKVAFDGLRPLQRELDGAAGGPVRGVAGVLGRGGRRQGLDALWRGPLTLSE